jgi:hypothetical protein
MRDGTLVRCHRAVKPGAGGPAEPDTGGNHRRPQREIPRSLHGRRGVTAPSRCRAVSGVTHGRAARRAWALMRSDQPCGRPAPPPFHRGRGSPQPEAPCLAGSLQSPPHTGRSSRRPGTAATELRKLSHAALGARPHSTSRSGERADIDGPGTSSAPNAGSVVPWCCSHRRVRRGRHATDLRFGDGDGTERPLLAVRHQAGSDCSRSTAAT